MFGQYLIKSKKISEEQLASALERQVIMGGRLGTNLIELGFLSENDLVQSLGQKFNMEIPKPEDLEKLDPSLTQLISGEIAEKYKIVPLKKDRTILSIASQDPENIKVIDELQFITGCTIKNYITSEIQIMSALERLYQIKKPLRFVPSKNQGPQNKNEKNTTPTSWLKKNLTPIEMEKALQEGKVALANAKDRDEALGNLLRMTHAVLERGILFLIKPGKVMGYKGFPEYRAQDITRLNFNLSDLPIFSGLVQTKTFFQGTFPDEPYYKDILQVFGGDSPEEVILLPIMLNQNVIAIFYGEKHGSPITTQCLEFLKNSTQKASMAFEILILKNKIMEM
ncbi:MAG TPA: hypothetical protein VGB26_04325 [Nitrospiria bacterium]|jgi:hypothetical protein